MKIEIERKVEEREIVAIIANDVDIIVPNWGFNRSLGVLHFSGRSIGPWDKTDRTLEEVMKNSGGNELTPIYKGDAVTLKLQF